MKEFQVQLFTEIYPVHIILVIKCKITSVILKNTKTVGKILEPNPKGAIQHCQGKVCHVCNGYFNRHQKSSVSLSVLLLISHTLFAWSEVYTFVAICLFSFLY